MISYLIDIILCGLVVFAELIGVFVAMLLIQLISYRIFKINIYKKIIKHIEKI